jgi:hypothetical protein
VQQSAQIYTITGLLPDTFCTWNPTTGDANILARDRVDELGNGSSRRRLYPDLRSLSSGAEATGC